MSDESVRQLAEVIGTPVDRLLLQIEEAGLEERSADDSIKKEEKEKLLSFLKESHGEDSEKPRKITLKRRTLSTLKTGGAAGRGRTVNVEVRKKRTYVRRGPQKDDVEGKQDAEKAPEVLLEASEQKLGASSENLFAGPDNSEQEILNESELEKSAQKSKQGAKEREEKAGNSSESRNQIIASVTTNLVDEGKLEEGTRASSKKNRKGKRDLDDDEGIKKKKTRQGARKRRVEELISEDLLEEEIIETTVVPQEAGDGEKLGLAAPRAKRPPGPRSGKRHTFNVPTEEIKREVEIAESVSIQQLSQKMSVKAADLIKSLFNLGIVKNINDFIDQDTAQLLAEEFGHEVRLIDAETKEKGLEDDLVYFSEPVARAPVVTVMGHVDHGKTSLLDYIRKSQIVDGEAGGITQHIGAYRVVTEHGEICFIDTPGHSAFSAMRARGASATDIVILVVAADDGVMPQTEEAVQHAKGAGAPIVVAVNKMDKDGADIERVKNELAAREVIPEEWGGDTQFVPCSAINGEGIEQLLEAVLLQSELLELSAVKDGPGQGVVIESELDKGKGPIVTLLVQNGQIEQGDVVVAGQFFGKARALSDENREKIKLAGPATPVSVLGFNGTPNAGDRFRVTKDEKQAREIASYSIEKANQGRFGNNASLDNLFDNFVGGQVKHLNIVVKADVRGSLEAITSSLDEIGNEEVKVNIVMQGVGAITESDANYAITSQAVVFGFNVRADNAAKKVIEGESIDLRYYKVIYDLVDDVKAALTGMLSPEVREEVVGIAEVRDVFKSKKFGPIAGCMVVNGSVHRSKKIRVLRENIVIYEGELESLRRFKDEVEQVTNGTECGIGVKNYNDVKVGDQIEVFDSKEVAREL
ncbi:MAG: translation initiation factor IF-2 [Gammaproteobacteria bacterium]|nr:translation initiation factor IF-2 [Gammaproteobacteria bacterium]